MIPLDPTAITFRPLEPSFHPHLVLLLNTSAPAADCDLHLDFALPDALFVDRDELQDVLQCDWTVTPDAVDIERAVRPNERLSHLTVMLPSKVAESRIDIPLHARYLMPNEAGREVVRLFGGGVSGQVRGGWICDADGSSDLPLVETPLLSLSLPTGIPAHMVYVQYGTTGAIWLCFAYLAYKIVALTRRLDGQDLKGPVKAKTL